MWDPAQYLRFAEERARPFYDLLDRVGAADPRHVADLGCGPGNLTAVLARRWPAARVTGIDNSPEMVSAAAGLASARPGLSFELGDLRGWRPSVPVDVLVCNAVLQWVPEHLSAVRAWPGMLADGGWLALQVPGNAGQPSHAILRDLAGSARWRPLLAGAGLNRQAPGPGEYLDLLARAGCEVDAWETTYLHVLTGEDPVLEWYRGTRLRPMLALLGEGDRQEFLAAYAERVREAYPAGPYGTVLPFRRVFAVARRTG